MLVLPDLSRHAKQIEGDGFRRFIELPRSGPLTVLDYLTLNDQALLFTSERRVPVQNRFRLSDLRAGTVSEMPGAGAAHGVALLPD